MAVPLKSKTPASSHQHLRFILFCFQVETFEGKLKEQEAEMELLHQQLNGAKEELKDASLQAREQKETAVIFKEKYTAAIKKVHEVQGQVEHLQEELQYSQQQVVHSLQYL